MGIKQKAVELSKNQKAVAGLVKLGAFVVILGVVLYCDIQFIQVMWRTFPDGAAKIFSLIGAVATGMSVIALIGAEAFWFSRGSQMVWGWIFTTVEVIISAMNVILSFEMTGGTVDPFMQTWLWFCPATPVVAALFWVLLFNLDQGQKARHDHREMEDDIAESNREHEKAVHTSKMQLKARYLESTTSYLEQIADDPRVQASLQAGAWRFAAEELRNLTGMSLQMPQLTTGQSPTVDGSLAPASSAPQTKPDEEKTEPQPETPKRGGFFKNPFAPKQEAAPATNTKEPDAAPTQPPIDMEAMFQAFTAWQAQRAHTDVHVNAPGTAPRPTTPEQEYVVNKQPGHNTENLAPFVAAPTETNGNGANGHTHLKP